MSTNGPKGPQTADKTGALKFSQNYVWNTADCLGRGATASVHLGRNRTTGDVVAVKVFHERESHQIALARYRELELLRGVSHKNVIKLLAIENELSNHNEVLVMPYCQGGSLHSVLEQPQYGFGFPEEEFLVFLEHLAGGMEYLRARGIIHRDIKPGNIMKFIEDNGRPTFKLTDFGAARELADEETFMSIYGTEEYLHPDMYQRAVLRQSGQQHFGSNVDLWSLGVTIFHVATGHLPFQPYGGRVNTQTMFEITTKKESGVISGIQTGPDELVKWSRTLPETCLLSGSLKKLITPMLAGLLESNSHKSWTFEQFFSHVNLITNMTMIKFFHHSFGTQLKLFLRKKETYPGLQKLLSSETDISASSQLLLIANKELTEQVDVNTYIEDYPKHIVHGTVFVYDKDSQHRQLFSPEIAAFPELRLDSSLSTDASEAKKSTAIAIYIERQTEQTLQNQKRLIEGVDYLREYVRKLLNPIALCHPENETIMQHIKKRMDTIKLCQENLLNAYSVVNMSRDLYKEIDGAVGNGQDFFKPLSSEHAAFDIFQKATQRNEEIKVYMSVLLEKIREQEVDAIGDCIGCQEKDYCYLRVQQLKQTISGIATIFLKHKRYGELHPHEVFIHKVEKQKLAEQCMNILSVFQSHCYQNTKHVYSITQKQTSILTKHLMRANKVETNVNCVKECQRTIGSHLDKLEEEYVRKTNEINQLLLRHMAQGRTAEGNNFHGCVQEQKQGHAHSKENPVKNVILETLVTELKSLELERCKVDVFLQENSLKLKRYLQETGHLRKESLES